MGVGGQGGRCEAAWEVGGGAKASAEVSSSGQADWTERPGTKQARPSSIALHDSATSDNSCTHNTFTFPLLLGWNSTRLNLPAALPLPRFQVLPDTVHPTDIPRKSKKQQQHRADRKYGQPFRRQHHWWHGGLESFWIEHESEHGQRRRWSVWIKHNSDWKHRRWFVWVEHQSEQHWRRRSLRVQHESEQQYRRRWTFWIQHKSKQQHGRRRAFWLQHESKQQYRRGRPVRLEHGAE